MVCDDHRRQKRGFHRCRLHFEGLSEQHIYRLFGVPAADCVPLSDAAPNHAIKSVVAASDHPHDLPAELP
jgi:hypothetical protein